MKKFVVGGLILLLMSLAIGAKALDRRETYNIPVNPNAKPATGMASAVITTPVYITYDNIEKYLSNRDFVREFPDDVQLLLKFYNGNGIERTYILEKGKVYEGELEDPDVEVNFNSKYLERWSSNNFCETIREAKNNGDLEFNLRMWMPKAILKFRSMSKYRECFGL